MTDTTTRIGRAGLPVLDQTRRSAIRSTRDSSVDLIRAGAYSLMLSQVFRSSAVRSVDDPSECDSAAAAGVVLITVGAIGGGPVGAIAGFVYGVGLLVSAC